MYLNWNALGAKTRFGAAVTEANFQIVQGVSTNLQPDQILAGSVPQLQYLFATLPTANGRRYKFVLSMPMSSLSLTPGTYPFATRLMTVNYAGRNPSLMAVPILSLTNGLLVTAWILTVITALKAIFAAAGPAFELFALNIAPTSEIYFDSEFTVPSDVSEDKVLIGGVPAAIVNWAGYGVTPDTLSTFLVNHALAIAQGPGAGLVITMPFLNPSLSAIGQIGDNSRSYLALTKALTNGLYGIGLQFKVNDQSLSLKKVDPERDEIATAADYSGSYACQFIGGVVLLPALQYVLQRQATWVELGADLLDPAINLGWNGGAFVKLGLQQSGLFVTA